LEYNLFDNIIRVFTSGWHFAILFQDTLKGVVTPYIFVTFISLILIKRNVGSLDRKIKLISFGELRRPSLEVNEKLHDCREDLFRLRDQIELIRSSIHPEVDKWFQEFYGKFSIRHLDDESPITKCDYFLTYTEELSRFLMDSFQLLISTVSTLDAQTGLQQARQESRTYTTGFLIPPIELCDGHLRNERQGD
jgi:hypothetical protein